MFKRAFVFVLLISFGLFPGNFVLSEDQEVDSPAGKSISEQLTVDKWERNYIIHLPAGYTEQNLYPLVLCFHGRGGNAQHTENKTGFSDISDREGFIVVYPNGINKAWYLTDNRRNQPDDMKFVEELVEHLKSNYLVDPSRIYATGHSNGGFLSIWLAVKQSVTFAAIASVSGGLVEVFKAEFKPSEPVSVLLMHGTKDATVPFNGGKLLVKNLRDEGFRIKIISTLELVDLWVKYNQCNPKPVYEDLPNESLIDGTTVSKTTYVGGASDSEVVLYTINNGRHGWPTQSIDMSSITPGTCRDIEAAEEIWNFFKEHSTNESSSDKIENN